MGRDFALSASFVLECFDGSEVTTREGNELVVKKENRLWINYYFISLWYERNVFLLDNCSLNKFRKIYMTFHMWNELTILWNDLTIDWNDLIWNDVNDLTMERNYRLPSCP